MSARVIALAGLLALALGAAVPAQGTSDPRFAGEYCGEHVVRVRVTVRFLGIPIVRRTETLTFAVEARVGHGESAGGVGTLRGSGLVEGEGRRIPFTLVGAVTRPGAAAGAVTAPGLGTAAGNAYLLDGGETVAVSGLGQRVVLSKAACGNRAPAARIVRPASGASQPWGTPVELAGTASDPEDGLVPAQRMVWTSSRDGRLGVGPSLSRNFLSRGEHQITLTATDSGGRSTADSATLRILNNAPNRPQILSPADGARLVAGLPATLRGRATDRDSGDLTGRALEWTSSLDGELGFGERVTPTLSLGRHTITLTASDGDGDRSSASITVDVAAPSGDAPPTVSVVAPRDLLGIADFDCVVLIASAIDLEDGPLGDAAISWSSSWETAAGTTATRSLSSGRRIEVCTWPTGGGDTVHTVTATATDSAGLAADDAVRIYVIPGGLI